MQLNELAVKLKYTTYCINKGLRIRIDCYRFCISGNNSDKSLEKLAAAFSAIIYFYE